jgi:hypothetical protein
LVPSVETDEKTAGGAKETIPVEEVEYGRGRDAYARDEQEQVQHVPKAVRMDGNSARSEAEACPVHAQRVYTDVQLKKATLRKSNSLNCVCWTPALSRKTKWRMLQNWFTVSEAVSKDQLVGNNEERISKREKQSVQSFISVRLKLSDKYERRSECMDTCAQSSVPQEARQAAHERTFEIPLNKSEPAR